MIRWRGVLALLMALLLALAASRTGTGAAPSGTLTPTPDPTRPTGYAGNRYRVQPGDTLASIAALYGVEVRDILALNPDLPDPDRLVVGQVLDMPSAQVMTGPANKLIPDSELIYSPAASDFDVAAFVARQPGLLRDYREDVDGQTLSGAAIIVRVAQAHSVNPRLLLALLEYRGGWLSDPAPGEEARQYPLGIHHPGREGLFRQMMDAAGALNAGYYGWKYRGRTSFVLGDGTRVLAGPGLNAGTVGVQSMLALSTPRDDWRRDASPDAGLLPTYRALFGDPFARAWEPVVPAGLQPPTLALPFGPGEEWVYTGGPHSAYNSGAGWAAIDLAPPEPPPGLVAAEGACYVAPYWVTAAAAGVIARSGDGWVILDLDRDGNADGDEYTGWTLAYFHIDAFERIPAGTRVQPGDPLGHPSCAGGFSRSTHLHIARRYNGEWIPAQCHACAPGVTVPFMTFGEWTVCSYPGQAYQGCMTRPGPDGYRQAEMTRDYPLNKIMWEDDSAGY